MAESTIESIIVSRCIKVITSAAGNSQAYPGVDTVTDSLQSTAAESR